MLRVTKCITSIPKERAMFERSVCKERWKTHHDLLQPLSRMAEKGYNYPKVDMPGSGPVAPPRSSRKRGGLASAEPSPAPSRTATLPRKPSSSSLVVNPMAGRPLPPPPPVEPKGYKITPF